MALKQGNFRIDEEILGALNEIRERDGIPVSEQVRRALRQWIDRKTPAKSGRKRAATRKRP